MKGVFKTKNVRLVELVKISHKLAFKYKYVYISYIPREENKTADMLSRIASEPKLVSE